ncbi:predicted protein [Nematostella vectensis]|uniref:Uncharacterized protein n=1 Tax=Nematostella vectensis TaxID=45351 RepID=A7RW22_NEMVE|nr:predicted protein [Nematostella vectensis]|eukprot:XP_001636441.1 predicted protein [Nematostella vectensis]
MELRPKLEFLKYHQGNVRGVAFSPVDRYLFCSGAYDGKLNIYSARKCRLLGSYPINTLSIARNINGVRFTADGRKILAATTARRLAVLDSETGEQILTYDNCVFNGRDRTGIAVDLQGSPHVAVATCVDGHGLCIFDLRMPLPAENVYNLHGSIIRDIVFIHDSWPWCKGHSALLTASVDGTSKVSTLDGYTLQSIDIGSAINSVAPTPEPFGSMADDGFYSLIMYGGEQLVSYVPEVGVQEHMKEHGSDPLWKIRYTSNGSSLFTACDKGVIRRYRRFPDHHEYVGELFHHSSDVEDIDISPYDECIHHFIQVITNNILPLFI